MSSGPSNITFEHRDGFGVGTATPRLSWQLPAGGRAPSGYEIEKTNAGGRTETTGPTTAAGSVLIDWPFAPLPSRGAATVRVRMWDLDAQPSAWSEPVVVEAALLQPGDWVARPVGALSEHSRRSDLPPVRVRRRFHSDQVSTARLYVTAHGLFQVEINGRRVGADELTPEWTVYHQRLTYRTYDVTEHLHAGDNMIGAWLADGWYRGRIGFLGGTRAIYGTDQMLLAQLEITHPDGARTIIPTGPEWEVGPSPITLASLYDGETFDARLADPNWSTRHADDHGWSPATTGQQDLSILAAAVSAPIRVTQERVPQTVTARGDGRYLLDFGQNLVGHLAFDVQAEPGRTVQVRHAEVLEDGQLAVGALREARAEDTYICRGEGVEHVEPRFTVHGFRYTEITGGPSDTPPEAVVAKVIHTDMRRSGWFGCSDPQLEKLHENVVWSMRGNMVGLPTDCPARDERLGWTGDLQVFAPTAAFLYDCAGLIDSWLRDVALEQLPDGTVPWYVPVVPGGPWAIHPGAAWGDVSTLTPWVLYQRFGDVELLRRHYPTGRRWVDLVERLAGPGRLWDQGVQLGDWLEPAAPPDDPAGGLTDRYLVATAYFAWSAATLARSAQELGYPDDAARYAELADQVRSAFARRWLQPGGRLSNDTATAYSLAIVAQLLDEQDRPAAGGRLAELVEQAGYRITTGFVGTPLICDALTDTGHLDTAYRLLLQTECPSWLYPVTTGATTIWERWDSLQPDGTLNTGGMTSFNHYALGAVADWMHRTIAGIAPASPGYRRIRFRPRPGGGLTSAWARHDTAYGTAGIEWHVDDDRVLVSVTVPAGCSATLELPDGRVRELEPGDHTDSWKPDDVAASDAA